MLKHGNAFSNLRSAIAATLALLGVLVPASAQAQAGAPAGVGPEGKRQILGHDKIVAFTFLDKYDPTQLRSLSFLTPARAGEWKQWKDRGVTPAATIGWYKLLKSPVEDAVNTLVGLDYGGDPNPVVCIDEFGFDFGGETDQKTATILEQTKLKKPELALAVWEMRGPIPRVLAEAYRKVVDLVLMEAYVGDKGDYWWIMTQAHAARMHGLLGKSIIALGLGVGGNPGELWAQTKEELEQQIRFIRLVAPESPGIGFFAPKATPELLAYADELCGRFYDIPTDGTGLPQDVVELYRSFSKQYDKPVLVCSPAWVEPNRSAPDPGTLVQPKTMRAYVMNLGAEDAKNVTMRLRNPKDAGGDVFAEAVVPVMPAKSETIAVLPVTAKWNVWKTWDMEIEGAGCTSITYKFAR